MIRLFCRVIFFLVILENTSAQNLVPNPSFEIISTCPPGHNLGNSDWVVENWHIPPGSITTPDLFSTCYNGTIPMPPYQNVGVPANFMGFANPKSGNNYMGLLLKYGQLTGGENLQIQLTQPLIAGRTYLCGFNIQRADSSQYQVNRAGMHISQVQEFQNLNQTMDLVPQIENNTGILYDSLNWVTIQDIYVASGGEQYITIGNFFTNENTESDSIPLGTTGANGWNSCCRGYYLFDDVFVIPYTENLSAEIPVEVCTNDTVVMQAQGSAAYNWYLNGLWYSGDSAITIVPTQTTTVSVQGYVDNISAQIIVADNCPPDCKGILNIPNVFTPNNDGVNDLFAMIGIDERCYQITVLNRWGNLIYKSSDESRMWDGNNQFGEPVSDGVYFFIVEWKTAQGIHMKRQEAVSLIRN